MLRTDHCEVNLQTLDGAVQILNEMFRRVRKGWRHRSCLPPGAKACNSYGGNEPPASEGARYFSTEGAYMRACSDEAESVSGEILARWALLNALNLPLQVVGSYVMDIDLEWEWGREYGQDDITDAIGDAVLNLRLECRRLKQEAAALLRERGAVELGANDGNA